MEAQALTIKCPECGSKRVFCDGFRRLPTGKPIQRYRCADYGHRWSKHFPRKSLKVPSVYRQKHQVGVDPAQDAKNLDKPQEIKTCVRNRKHTPTDNEINATPQIEKLLQQLLNDGRTEGTADNYRKNFKRLLREGADLFDPESTKQALAKSTMAKNAKRSCAAMLNVWFEFNEIKWKRPRYTRENKIPHIPTEKTLTELIAALGKKTAAYCQILLETGARAGEISALTWDDIDFEQRTVNIVAEKGSMPRLPKLSQKALDMLANLRKSKKPFANADDMRSNFHMQRIRIAKKLGKPEILKVHFHSFRHFKATMAYHQTKDLIHVQELLGHKNIEITRSYIYIEKSIFQSTESDKFHVKVAKTQAEIIDLLEQGFEYITQKDDLAYFRKRK
jgi:integrase